jgi:hypothetical protein
MATSVQGPSARAASGSPVGMGAAGATPGAAGAEPGGAWTKPHGATTSATTSRASVRQRRPTRGSYHVVRASRRALGP